MAPPETLSRAINIIMLKHKVSMPEACSIIDGMDLDTRGELYESQCDPEGLVYVLLA